MIRISAFADEISPEPCEQLDCLQSLGIRHVEFRSIFGKNVLDLSTQQHLAFQSLLERRGFTLSAIGSPIGKIPIVDPFEPHLDRLKIAIDLAHLYGTPRIRVFSFYLPIDDDPALHRDEVMRRMAAMADLARDREIVLVLENEKGIYGDTADRVLDVLESVGSASLGHAFDPANYLEIGQDIDDAWQKLGDRTVHFHVKDYQPTTKKFVPAGEGDGQIGRLIAAAVARGFRGFCTLEPHLIVAEKSHGFTGPERFGDASRALKSELAAHRVALS